MMWDKWPDSKISYATCLLLCSFYSGMQPLEPLRGLFWALTLLNVWRSQSTFMNFMYSWPLAPIMSQKLMKVMMFSARSCKGSDWGAYVPP